jgi:hypothetical protein
MWKILTVGSLGLGAVVAPPAAAAATFTYELFQGSFSGTLTPVSKANQTDYFETMATGTLRYEDASDRATLSLSFQGKALDELGGAEIGGMSGTLTYVYDNVSEIVASGNHFLLSTEHLGSSLHAGDGTAAADITFSAPQLVDNVVIDLQAMQFAPAAGSPGQVRNPALADFLSSAQLGTYLVLGTFNEKANQLASWFSSGQFFLDLGPQRTVLYTLNGDIHASSGTEVPEPTTVALLGAALAAFMPRRRRT